MFIYRLLQSLLLPVKTNTSYLVCSAPRASASACAPVLAGEPFPSPSDFAAAQWPEDRWRLSGRRRAKAMSNVRVQEALSLLDEVARVFQSGEDVEKVRRFRANGEDIRETSLKKEDQVSGSIARASERAREREKDAH